MPKIPVISSVHFKKAPEATDKDFVKLSREEREELLQEREEIARTIENDPLALKGIGGEKKLEEYRRYTAKLRSMS